MRLYVLVIIFKNKDYNISHLVTDDPVKFFCFSVWNLSN